MRPNYSWRDLGGLGRNHYLYRTRSALYTSPNFS